MLTTLILNEFSRRFWTKIARAGPDDCWEWQAKTRKDGYGIFKVCGRNVKATHVALELSGKPRPDGLFALHSCDNPACCNPAHLRWGTAKENMDDMRSRGRNRIPTPVIGEAVHTAKLTEHDVVLIRRSGLGYKSLAREYGVERTTIRSIKRRETWRHVA